MRDSRQLIPASTPLLIISAAAAQSICGSWSQFNGPEIGGTISDAYILRIVQWDDGSGPSRFMAGRFEGADPAIRHIARWDGELYHPLGTGLGSLEFGVINDLLVFDEGTGTALYAAGQFTNPIGNSPGFARWDGTAWAFPLSLPPFGGHGSALAGVDDGTTSSLYIALAGGLVRVQNGNAAYISGAPTLIYAMTAFDDGSGPALFIGGNFTSAGGVSVRSVAKFQNGTWSDVGGGVYAMSGTPATGRVHRLAVLDDGTGPGLFIAGSFTRVGDPSNPFTPGFARWKDNEWKIYPPNGPGFVSTGGGAGWAIGMLETTSPPTLLFAAPYLKFTPVEGPEIKGGLLAYSEQAGWMEAGPPGDGGIYELNWLSSDRLLVAGRLPAAGLPAPPTMAAWTPCPPCYANCDRSTTPPVLTVDDFTCFINRFAHASTLPHERQVAEYANCDRSTAPPVLTVDDFTCFINAFAQGCP